MTALELREISNGSFHISIQIGFFIVVQTPHVSICHHTAWLNVVCHESIIGAAIADLLLKQLVAWLCDQEELKPLSKADLQPP